MRSHGSTGSPSADVGHRRPVVLRPGDGPLRAVPGDPRPASAVHSQRVARRRESLAHRRSAVRDRQLPRAAQPRAVAAAERSGIRRCGGRTSSLPATVPPTSPETRGHDAPRTSGRSTLHARRPGPQRRPPAGDARRVDATAATAIGPRWIHDGGPATPGRHGVRDRSGGSQAGIHPRADPATRRGSHGSSLGEPGIHGHRPRQCGCRCRPSRGRVLACHGCPVPGSRAADGAAPREP